MPSKYATIGVVVLLILAGCSMVPGGDGGSVGTAPSHHELVFASDIDTFEATITVEKDGEQVYQRNVSEEDGLFVNLTALAEPGPYTVTVETDVQVGGDPMSERMRIPGDTGNVTVVELDYASISTTRYSLPRQKVGNPMASNFRDLQQNSKRLDIELFYRGKRVGNQSKMVRTDELQYFLQTNRTGVYTVRARTDDDWTQESVVLAEPDTYIRIDIDREGNVGRIYVRETADQG
jgi:hypothetical protein